MSSFPASEGQRAMYSYTARKLEAHNAQAGTTWGSQPFTRVVYFPPIYGSINKMTKLLLAFTTFVHQGDFLAVVLTSRLRKAGSTNISLHAKDMGSHEYHSFIIIDAVPPAKTRFPKVSPP